MYTPHQIAVAVPTYSRPDLLFRLTQTIPSSVKVFVSDNGGSMRASEQRFADNVVISHADCLLPIFANWNRAVKLVNAEATHLLIPSDDDLYLRDGFNHVETALNAHPDADIIIFGCDYVDEFDGRRKGYCPRQLESFSNARGFLHFVYGVEARMPGVLFRRAFLDRIGAFDERFLLTAADSELVQRALLLGKSVFVPEVIGLYRVWEGGLTHSKQATDQWLGEIRVWTDKLIELMRQNDLTPQLRLDFNRYKDEILGRNMVAGVAGLLARGEFEQARSFLNRHHTPAFASLRTKVRLSLQRYTAWKKRSS